MAEEDGVCSNDSSLFRRARDLYGNGVEDEVTSQFSRKGGGPARGQSKENLWVEFRSNRLNTRNFLYEQFLVCVLPLPWRMRCVICSVMLPAIVGCVKAKVIMISWQSLSMT
ncbi:hypothetical protein ZWY2020_057990 [Hordeum vulgare]|nr:hypothetical protein ZWY2020_057990 [Hordeum vulgare]